MAYANFLLEKDRKILQEEILDCVQEQERLVTPTQPTLKLSPPAAPGDGSIANDIPGTSLAIGSSRKSVVDRTTKPRDVYALTLTAGREIKISVTDHPGQLNFKIAAPGSISFKDNDYKELFNSMGQYTSSPWSLKYVAAISGTYYLAVNAWEQTSQPYVIEITIPGVTYGDTD